MNIGIKGIARIELIRVGQPFQCSCGRGTIATVEPSRDGDYRAACVCKRTISVSRTGSYTPAYPVPNEVALAA